MLFFFFKQKTAYELRISDWSSDVCSSDLAGGDQRVIGRKDHRHVRLAFRIVPAKLSTICASPSPCTTRPRRKISRPVSRTRSTIASSGSPLRPAPTNCADRSRVTECPAASETNRCEAGTSARHNKPRNDGVEGEGG